MHRCGWEMLSDSSVMIGRVWVYRLFRAAMIVVIGLMVAD